MTHPELDGGPEPTTQTGLQAPRLSKPVAPPRLPRPRLPTPSVPPRPSLAPTEENNEPPTQLRHAATRTSLPALPSPDLALTPAMPPILPPPMAGLPVQERTAILTFPPIDPTPPPEVAIRTPFAMVVPPEDRYARVLTLTPPVALSSPLEAEVLGQRLPLSRVAVIVGATLVVAALVVIGLRSTHASAGVGLGAEGPPSAPVTELPAPPVASPPVASPPVAASSLPDASPASRRPGTTAHPPARRGPSRGRPRIPARRDQ